MKPRLLPVLALAALAACGSSPKEYFYTLLGSGDATLAQPNSGAAYSVAVGQVSVPDMVDRPQLVLRAAAENQVTLSEQSRWAEPLRSAIPRVIAGNLARELPDARLSVYPQAAGEDADLRVSTDIQRFDSTLGEGVVLEALWTVQGKDGVRSGRSLVRESARGKDNDALVAAHGEALRALSGDIANAIRDLPRPETPSSASAGSAKPRAAPW